MRWCSECGAEHEDWASACALCDSAVTDHPPVPEAPMDHSLGSLDVSSIGADQRSRLAMVLRSRQVPFELVAHELRFPEARRRDAEATLAELRDEEWTGPTDPAFNVFDDDDALVGAGQDKRDGAADSVRLGSTSRRVAAELIGGLIWGVVLPNAGWLAEQGGVPLVAGFYAGILVSVLVDVTLVSRFGADPGKFVLGLRIVDADDRWPRWSQALLRLTVLTGPYWVLGAAADVLWEWNRQLGQALVWAPLVWVGLVVWSIASNPQRQGWHDRVARTWVIRRRRNGQSTPST